MKRLLALAAIVAMSLSVMAVALASPPEKVTICHAAGQDDTTHFVELTLSYNAAYGQAGHFYENGTPQAGHENDIEGPCPTPPTSSSTPTSSTTSTTQPSTTTTTAPSTTSSTVSTTTTPPVTVATTSSTTTTSEPTSTTVTPPTTTTTTGGSTSTTTTTEAPPLVLPLTGASDLIPIALIGLALLSLGVLSLRATGSGADE